MAEEQKPKMEEKKEEVKKETVTEKKEEKKEEKKTETKKETKKPVSDVKEVVVRANDASVSTKHAMAICKFMKHRKIDYCIEFLEDVTKFKKAVPMKGEIPHRKGIGTGRYPIKASAFFIKLLKNLKANASSRNVDASKLVIEAKTNLASRPRKPGKYHRKFKRSHIEVKGVLK